MNRCLNLITEYGTLITCESCGLIAHDFRIEFEDEDGNISVYCVSCGNDYAQSLGFERFKIPSD
jgi:hypothetical protein